MFASPRVIQQCALYGIHEVLVRCLLGINSPNMDVCMMLMQDTTPNARCTRDFHVASSRRRTSTWKRDSACQQRVSQVGSSVTVCSCCCYTIAARCSRFQCFPWLLLVILLRAATALAAVKDHSKDVEDAATGPIIGIDLGTTYSWRVD